MEILILLALAVGVIWFIKKQLRNRAETDFGRQKDKLTPEKVVNEWSALVNGGKGRGEAVLGKLKRDVEQEELPNVAVSMREIETDDGEKRKFLSIGNTRVKGYDLLVSAYDYGSRLCVVWYLIFDSPWAHLQRKRAEARPGVPMEFAYRNEFARKAWKTASEFGKKSVEGGYAAASEHLGYRDPEVLTMSERQELQNYASIVSGLLKRDVKDMMDELDIDFSRVDEKSRGFLNVS